VTLGFVVSKLEGGFFILRQAEHERFRLLMVIYVDDLLLIGEPAFVSQIKEEMKRRFDMHDLGAVDFYLGMKIERGSGFIDLSQSVFINTILHHFGMQDAKPVGTPMDAKLKLQKRGEEATCDKELYQSMLGSVMYAMTGTRPDILLRCGNAWKICSRSFGVSYGCDEEVTSIFSWNRGMEAENRFRGWVYPDVR
jgi:hypothetical protein